MTLLESWAPRALAWDRDNVGLLVGSPAKPVKRILVALDATDRLIDEARACGADLLVTHHPVIFGSLKSVTDTDRTGRLIAALIKHDIALYAAHTNLDFTKGGVSTRLAIKLGLVDLEVLHKDEHRYQKIVVFVPAANADTVLNAMAAAGAGHIGKYDNCSFASPGTGTFRPLKGSKPYIGAQDRLESVSEVRLEMVCPAWRSTGVLDAMQTAHPYEEVAFDVYDLANASSEYGAGIIGTLPVPTLLRTWLRDIHRRLKTPVLRYCGDPRKTIRRIAVCGGSGADLLPVAIRRGADAFVTADLKYHAFQDAGNAIALIDAGHFETEHPIVDEIVLSIAAYCRERHQAVSVRASRRSQNPVQYSRL